MDFALLRPLEPRGIGCRMAWLVLGSVFVLVGMAQSQTMGQEVDGVESSPKPPVTGHVLPPPQPLETLKNIGPGVDGPGPGVLNSSSHNLNSSSHSLMLSIFLAMRFLSSRPVLEQPVAALTGQICVDCILTPDLDDSNQLPLETKFVVPTDDHPQLKIESFHHRTWGADQRIFSLTWEQASGPCLGVAYVIVRAADEKHFRFFELEGLAVRYSQLTCQGFQIQDSSLRDRPIGEDEPPEIFLAIKHADTWYLASKPLTSECESKLLTRPPTDAESQVFREATLKMENWKNELVPIPADVELPLGTKIWHEVKAGHWYQEGIVEEIQHRGQIKFHCTPLDHRGTTNYERRVIDHPTIFFIMPEVLAELPKHEKSVEAAPK